MLNYAFQSEKMTEKDNSLILKLQMPKKTPKNTSHPISTSPQNYMSFSFHQKNFKHNSALHDPGMDQLKPVFSHKKPLECTSKEVFSFPKMMYWICCFLFYFIFISIVFIKGRNKTFNCFLQYTNKTFAFGNHQFCVSLIYHLSYRTFKIGLFIL